jgi:hypothetical protein
MTERCSVDYQALIEVLSDLVAQHQSGTLFITSAEQHSAHFVLNDGRVCAVGYRFKRGMSAVEAIRQMRAGSYRFEANIVCAKSTTDLPDTQHLLALLTDVEPAIGAAAKRPAATHDESATTPRPMAPFVTLIQKQLTQYLGPVAEICCEDYLERTGGVHNLADLTDMVHTLSEEIADTGERREFEEASLAALEGGRV